MKNIIVTVAILLVSAVVFAEPKVGDYAIYEASYSASGINLQKTDAIFVITAFDSAANEYTYSLKFGDFPESTGKEPASTYSDKKISDILANCPNIVGAHPETILIPAGVYKTCVITEGSEYAKWYAEAPFGFVKSTFSNTKEGSNATIVLKSWGHRP